MTAKDFNKGDLVYTEDMPTMIGEVMDVRDNLPFVKWHENMRPTSSVQQLVKSEFTQAQVNKMMELAPDVFRCMEQMLDALIDKGQLSIWEQSVKLQIEKFMDYIKPEENGSDTK
jgi:hypothetical protein